MDAVADQFRRCKICGDDVAADRAKARAGMTVKHHISIEQSRTKPLCKGSKIRHADQPLRSEPWSPPGRRPIPKVWALVESSRRSPFRATLARLRPTHSITFVDFREAARQRALGHVTEPGHALRFVRMEVRDA